MPILAPVLLMVKNTCTYTQRGVRTGGLRALVPPATSSGSGALPIACEREIDRGGGGGGRGKERVRLCVCVEAV